MDQKPSNHPTPAEDLRGALQEALDQDEDNIDWDQVEAYTNELITTDDQNMDWVPADTQTWEHLSKKAASVQLWRRRRFRVLVLCAICFLTISVCTLAGYSSRFDHNGAFFRIVFSSQTVTGSEPLPTREGNDLYDQLTDLGFHEPVLPAGSPPGEYDYSIETISPLQNGNCHAVIHFTYGQHYIDYSVEQFGPEPFSLTYNLHRGNLYQFEFRGIDFTLNRWNGKTTCVFYLDHTFYIIETDLEIDTIDQWVRTVFD